MLALLGLRTHERMKRAAANPCAMWFRSRRVATHVRWRLARWMWSEVWTRHRPNRSLEEYWRSHWLLVLSLRSHVPRLVDHMSRTRDVIPSTPVLRTEYYGTEVLSGRSGLRVFVGASKIVRVAEEVWYCRTTISHALHRWCRVVIVLRQTEEESERMTIMNI